MLERIKGINNPLTVIAIFAGIAEIALTAALWPLDKSLQPIFMWFVILFPAALLLLFFLTLNFNSRVLYAPSDFRDDENYLKAQALRTNHNITAGVDQATAQVEAVKQVAIQAIADALPGPERAKLRQEIDAQFGTVEDRLARIRVESQARFIEALLTTGPFRLVFNPKNPAQQSKIMMFAPGGHITAGANKNEHSWRINGDKLELVQSDGQVHSRFAYVDGIFKSTDESDTKSIRGQYMEPQPGGGLLFGVLPPLQGSIGGGLLSMPNEQQHQTPLPLRKDQ